jgi:hypothetical protein
VPFDEPLDFSKEKSKTELSENSFSDNEPNESKVLNMDI